MPTVPTPGERTDQTLPQPPSVVPRYEDGTKGRIRCRPRYGGPSRVTPRLAWHPALRLHGSPNDAR